MTNKQEDTARTTPIERKLDLVELFSEHANVLIAAAKRGKSTHKTGNIAESGHPFETEFRRIFSDSFPSTIAVWPGFFMDRSWILSNQTDLMLCDTAETLQLPPSPGLSQHYVPLNSIHVFGQIKNSANPAQISNALEQNALNIQYAQEMRSRDIEVFQRYREPPISLVVFGRNGTAASTERALVKLQGEQPTYILLLEKGLVYARRGHRLMEFDPPRINFFNYREGGRLELCRPDGPEKERPGRALLWVFFALLSKVNFDNGNGQTFSALCDRISNTYPLLPDCR